MFLSNHRSRRKKDKGVNAGSMADIAFLLLIFFLVTTTIASDKGIAMLLPPLQEDEEPLPQHNRNILNIVVNSQDQLLVENEIIEVSELTEKSKKFVNNFGIEDDLSDSPQKAIVSIKTDRGTSYKQYLTVLDEVKRAYNELRAEHLKMTLAEYHLLDKKNPDHHSKLLEAKEAFPMRISDAEPMDLGN